MLRLQIFDISPVTACWKAKNEPGLVYYCSEDQIKQLLVAHFNMPFEKIKSRSRTKELVKARQVGIYLMRQKTDLSCKTIGLMFGGRDHTSVLHSLTTIRNLMDTEPDFRREVESLLANVIVHASEIPAIKQKKIIKFTSRSQPPAEYSNHSPLRIAK